MPAKITKEVRERIYDLNKEGKSVKEILVILGVDGIKISDKSIYRILKEKKNNESMASFEESFNESFGDDLNMEEALHVSHDWFVMFSSMYLSFPFYISNKKEIRG